MRGVLGALFLATGVIVAYVVLSGKFPSSASVASASSGGVVQDTSNSVITDAQWNQRYRNQAGAGSGPDVSTLGIPTVKHLQDMNAHSGGMYS
jgi:hypothetical protein